MIISELWPLNSAGECLPYKQKVASSILAAATIFFLKEEPSHGGANLKKYGVFRGEENGKRYFVIKKRLADKWIDIKKDGKIIKIPSLKTAIIALKEMNK